MATQEPASASRGADEDPQAPPHAASAALPQAASPAPPPPIDDMLAKVAAFVEGEADMSIEDYRLLEAMNLAAADRYKGMAEYSAGLVAFADRLQSKCDELIPQLAQIDVLEAQVGELEGAVAQLDSYSRRLERKFLDLRVTP